MADPLPLPTAHDEAIEAARALGAASRVIGRRANAHAIVSAELRNIAQVALLCDAQEEREQIVRRICAIADAIDARKRESHP